MFSVLRKDVGVKGLGGISREAKEAHLRVFSLWKYHYLSVPIQE